LSVKLYALSTCGWCRKAKSFLDENGVAYELTYVDLLEGEAREQVIQEVAKWNPRRSFPTIVIDDAKSVAGFKPELLKEALGL
jgi:glutaredoxin-like protein NrdH